jgi:hypothetical protein
MFCSALRTLKAHRVGPDESKGRIVNVKLEINGLSGLRAQTNEIAHRITRKMIGNESAEIIGKDFFDSRCLFTRCQSTDGHDRRPLLLEYVRMRPGNRTRNVALLKNFETVAIATRSVARRAYASTVTALPTSAVRRRQGLP